VNLPPLTVNSKPEVVAQPEAKPFPKNTAPCDWFIERDDTDMITASHSSGYVYVGTMDGFNKAMKA